MKNLNEKMKEVYCPDQSLSLDESMVFFCCYFFFGGGVALFLGSTLKTRSINTESNSMNYVIQVD